MKVEPSQVQAIRISDVPQLDPIIAIFQDIGPGQGRIIIECFGMALAGYWGAMGDRTIREFVMSCDTPYLTNALWPSDVPRSKHTKRYYVQRIVEAVKQAIKISDGNGVPSLPV